MIRIEALEDVLPKDWRRAVRDHPWLAISVAGVAGWYIGRWHGRQLLAALVSTGVAFGAEAARRALGVPARRVEDVED